MSQTDGRKQRRDIPLYLQQLVIRPEHLFGMLERQADTDTPRQITHLKGMSKPRSDRIILFHGEDLGLVCQASCWCRKEDTIVVALGLCPSARCAHRFTRSMQFLASHLVQQFRPREHELPPGVGERPDPGLPVKSSTAFVEIPSHPMSSAEESTVRLCARSIVAQLKLEQ